MKAIAISCYDKFQDVRILVDIIRENWEDDYFISLACNHPRGREEFEELDVDAYTQGLDINYDPEMQEYRRNINLNSRILDNLKKAIKPCLSSNADYTFHLMADSWPMREGALDELIEGMVERDAKVAYRGKGLTYRTPGYWFGHAMDQFFMVENDFCNESGIFDYDLLEIMPHMNNHTLLMLRFYIKAGADKVWHYSNMQNDLYWNGMPKKQVDMVRPAIFVPKYDLFHCATDSFPEDYGRQIQSIFLRKHNYDQGSEIESFIDNYSSSEDEIKENLDRINSKLDLFLRLLFFRSFEIGRDIKRKEKMIPNSLNSKLSALLKNITKEAYYQSHIALNKVFPFSDSRFKKEPLRRPLYQDAKWPKGLETYYSGFRKEDFPSKVNTWFEDHSSDE